MRRSPFVSLLMLMLMLGAGPGAQAAVPAGETIMLVGGPSLRQWEQYKAYPHDHWWANFVRAARLRTEQLRNQLGPDAKITWLIYKQGYLDRAPQEKPQDLIALINTVKEKFNINLVWFNQGPGEVINYMNNRSGLKISDFEYFGHSNKACFMFDYSSNIDSACKSWFHENDSYKLKQGIFARGAYVRSWGCHTGESMSKKWYAATGVHMIGAIGKTQFMMEELPILTSPGGKWVNY